MIPVTRNDLRALALYFPRPPAGREHLRAFEVRTASAERTSEITATDGHAMLTLRYAYDGQGSEHVILDGRTVETAIKRSERTSEIYVHAGGVCVDGTDYLSARDPELGYPETAKIRSAPVDVSAYQGQIGYMAVQVERLGRTFRLVGATAIEVEVGAPEYVTRWTARIPKRDMACVVDQMPARL